MHAFSPVIFVNPETIDEMSALRARQGNYVALLHSFCGTLFPPTRAAQSASYVFARPINFCAGFFGLRLNGTDAHLDRPGLERRKFVVQTRHLGIAQWEEHDVTLRGRGVLAEPACLHRRPARHSHCRRRTAYHRGGRTVGLTVSGRCRTSAEQVRLVRKRPTWRVRPSRAPRAQ